MSSTLSRLVLAGAAVAATWGIYSALYAVLERGRSENLALLLTTAATMAFFIPTWIAIWRPEIEWTSARRILTVVSIFWCMVIGAMAGATVAYAARRSNEFAIILSGLIWLPSWMASTALIWRETPAERAARFGGSPAAHVRCPQCRYDMTGLREARCPECGAQYTLDRLLAAAQEADFARSTESAETPESSSS